MQRLRVRLFGPVELYLGNKRLPEFPTRKSKFLFAYLVLNPGRVLSRDVVATEFWGDLPDVRARKALNTEFWRIGQLLRNVGLDPDNYLRSVSDGVVSGARRLLARYRAVRCCSVASRDDGAGKGGGSGNRPGVRSSGTLPRRPHARRLRRLVSGALRAVTSPHLTSWCGPTWDGNRGPAHWPLPKRC